MEFDPNAKIGEWITPQYQLVRLLGLGTYAAVYLGYSPRNNQHYAIKCLFKKGLSAQKIALQKEEAELHLRVKNHRSIVTLYDVIDTRDYFYLVMEHCDHPDLFDHIVETGGLDDVTTKNLMMQVIEAIEFCHESNVYHRDIKPENILLSDDKTALVADFGLATDKAYSTEFGVGSYPYMSPEVFNATAKSYKSAAQDVWSLGILLFSIRFSRTLWNAPSEEDNSFAIFTEDTLSLKRTFNLSNEAYELALAAFDLNPNTRCSIQEFKKRLQSIQSFTNEEKACEYPIKYDYRPSGSVSDASIVDDF